MKKKKNFGDILVGVLLVISIIMIAVYEIMRSADNLAGLIEGLKTDSGLRKAMPVFLLALAAVTAVIYLILGRGEGRKLSALRYSLTAATGILLTAGFVFMCFSAV